MQTIVIFNDFLALGVLKAGVLNSLEYIKGSWLDSMTAL